MPITPTSTKSKNYQALGIDEIANDIETAFTAINALEGGGSDYTETIVNISSAQILAMGSTPIELLPAAGAGKYYDYFGFCELHYGTAPYVFTADAILVGGADSYAGTLVDFQFLTQSTDKYVNFRNTESFRVGISGMTNQVVSSFGSINEAIIITSYNGANPTDGDGTLRVKIYHKTITFGA
jgi:hypothetical protein